MIPIRQDIVRTLIDRRFGSIDDFVVAWEARVASGDQRVGRPRDRSTVYRWIEEGLPSRKHDIFGFSGALDVDPVAIVRIDEEFVEQYFPAERRQILSDLVGKSLFSAFWSMYAPGAAWPSAEVPYNYYNRTWCTRDFLHDHSLTTNEYAAFYMEADADAAPYVPGAYHFAYRRLGAKDKMWRPYGTVMAYHNEVCLISESGNFQKVSDVRSSRLVAAETYFGIGDSEFRVAALHPFELRVNAPSQEKACVRFVG